MCHVPGAGGWWQEARMGDALWTSRGGLLRICWVVIVQNAHAAGPQYVIYKKQVCVPACMNVLLFATFWLTNYWVRVSLVGMVMIRARMGKFSPRGLYSSQVLCPTKCYKNASTKGCGTPGGSSTSVDKKNSWLKSGIANCASNTADYTCKKNDKCHF